MLPRFCPDPLSLYGTCWKPICSMYLLLSSPPPHPTPSLSPPELRSSLLNTTPNFIKTFSVRPKERSSMLDSGLSSGLPYRDSLLPSSSLSHTHILVTLAQNRPNLQTKWFTGANRTVSLYRKFHWKEAGNSSDVASAGWMGGGGGSGVVVVVVVRGRGYGGLIGMWCV